MRGRSSTPTITYLSLSPSGIESYIDSEIQDIIKDAFYKMKFFEATSLLELESLSGSKSFVSVSSVNGHTVELDVNSTPVSNLQALDDWDAI